MSAVQIVRAMLLFGAAIAAFACLSLESSLEREWLAAQRIPMPALGQTIPLAMKSTTVYVTPSQKTLFLWVYWGAFAAIGIGAMSAAAHKKWPIR